MIVSFDFDDTLTKAFVDKQGEVQYGPRMDYIQKLKDYGNKGHTIYIVTARNDVPRNHSVLNNFIKEHQLPVSKIFFTSHMPKGQILAKLKVDLHIDDKIEELESAKRHGINVEEAPFIPVERPVILDSRRMKRL
jgi:5'(3')-deoxyribonucleotidase